MRLWWLLVGATLLTAVATPSHATPVHPHPSNLPVGAPPALYRSEPVLPAPPGWQFGDGFPHTSGFGRVTGGATFWSDFVYDDHGAKGALVSAPVVSLSPPEGTFTYPDGMAAENGADIFRAAVGMDRDATWWRVDWLGLTRPALPAALWALDTDNSVATGATSWPAGAGVRSPGVERWLLVTGTGAWLLAPDGARVRVPVSADARSSSYVVKVPRSVLAVRGRWRVRLASGMANATGDGLAQVDAAHGALPGQPALFNVAFRSDNQERIVGENWWREDAQAAALTSGDVSAFSREISWADLAAHRSEPEPRPTGYTNRWYVSSIHAGHGVVRNPPESSSDLRPNYLDRVQPYGVFVPAGVARGRPVPLTLLLHSLNTQHNQYAAWNPTFLQSLCQERHSICLVPFARGPDSWFFDEGETDVWETWNRVARDYALDPSRTILAGYSMGGYGTYRLGLEHPDLFAQAVAMAGPPSCAVRLWYPVEVPADPGVAKCEHEADTSPLVGNARQLPFYIAQGAVDELVFSPSAVQQAGLFDALGYRYRFELYARQGHVSWAETGHFDGAVSWLRDRRLAATPARISYTFYASHQRPDLGSGPTGDWWVQGLRSRDTSAGAKGEVLATSHALPESTPVPVRSTDALMNSDGPAAGQQLTWGTASSTLRSQRIDLELKGVRALDLDVARAGLHGPRGLLHVTTDGLTRLRLIGLPAGTSVSHGALDQTLPRGSTDLVLRWPTSSSAPPGGPGALAATGATLPLWPAGLLLLSLALRPRRSRAKT